MNERKSFADGLQFAWDATSLSAFSKCPRFYQYEILEGWEPQHKSVHLIFGGHYATAIEHYHKHRAEGKAHDLALRLVVREALENTWDREANTSEEWTDAKKTRETLIRSIIWYLLEFGEDETMKPVLLDNGKPAVELSFSLDLGEFVYCGHLDRLCLYQGDPYVMDQKTTGGTISRYFFDGFKPGHQFAGYTLAGIVAYHIPVKGVVVDAAQIAVGFTRFERGFIGYSEPELQEWVGLAGFLIGQAKRMTLNWLDGKDLPMNPESCSNYGGCRFRGVCARPPAVRNNFLAADFKKREALWDPLERR